jgi:hypothetical protein
MVKEFSLLFSTEEFLQQRLKRYQGNEISKFSHLQKCDNKKKQKRRVDDGVCFFYNVMAEKTIYSSLFIVVLFLLFNHGRNNPFIFLIPQQLFSLFSSPRYRF